MRIALFGYGAMGHLIEAIANGQGDEVGTRFTSRDALLTPQEMAGKLRGHDVAIDFSIGGAVPAHVEACVLAEVPLVEGTTGWTKDELSLRQLVLNQGGTLVYGANFSLGVNLFYRIAAHAASLLKTIDSYAPFIEEAHHSRKRDAPSGTALRLRNLIAEQLPGEIPISSTRAGHIPGTHRVGFDSLADQILLTHTARSREGFATGALLAAHWIIGRKGAYEFSEVIDEIICRPDSQ